MTWHGRLFGGRFGGALFLDVDLRFIGGFVERPIAFRHGVIVSEIFRVTEVDQRDTETPTFKADYAGLRRIGALMSNTEKRLSPSRFPA